MGGSSNSGAFSSSRSPSELRKLVREAEEKTTGAAFETALASTLGDLIGAYNARDTKLVRERLDELKAALKSEMDGSFDQLFGGSVAKHTYVDGLSDIDSLIILDDSELEGKEPREALLLMEQVITKKLGDRLHAQRGRMAVTVDYADGMEIQLLPALRGADGRVHVPSSRHEGWSRIDPLAFQRALTARNQECGGKLVPVIKLAKAINGQLPKAQQLSGYHMESLAIAAFRNYAGEKATTAMLPTYFERARDLVLAPIRDRTGQSVHVDEYLGAADSAARQAASHVLSRIARRMRNATAAGSVGQWRALLGIDQ